MNHNFWCAFTRQWPLETKDVCVAWKRRTHHEEPRGSISSTMVDGRAQPFQGRVTSTCSNLQGRGRLRSPGKDAQEYKDNELG